MKELKEIEKSIQKKYRKEIFGRFVRAVKDFNLVEEFCKDIRIIDPTVEKTIQETPNGYGIILSHGFDSRKLMEHWSYVATIKKDDLKCVTWKRKC